MEKLQNPANRAGKTAEERKRIPMSVPVQKLETPDIPGFHLHWFNGTPDRIQRAVSGGYTFVDATEMHLNNTTLGGSSAVSGNTDLGSQVSIVAGKELGQDGQPIRMVLMKIKQEWYEEDQKLIAERNDKVAQSLTQGMIGVGEAADSSETNMRYVGTRTKIPDLFTKGAIARKSGR